MGSENVVGQGEYRTTDEPLTGFITGAFLHHKERKIRAFVRKEVKYSLIDEDPIFEGDIILDLDEEAAEADEGLLEAAIISDSLYRWTDGIVPYEIDGALPNQSRVHDAIAHWEEHTIIRFIERTTANASDHPNYILFRPSSGCSSYVGMRGWGMQPINLASACSLGNTIHEIGHAVGLWHEQSREDRDDWITVHYDNILPAYVHNFDQHIADGDDIGPYDYASIMHYGPTAFSNNGDTITPLYGGPIGQRIGLSAGDIAGVWYMYHDLVGGQVMSMKFACGSTTPGATNWINYGSNGIYVNVDTSAAEFTETPKYFTSIGGNSNHWTTMGASSIYLATATGFRIYIYKSGGITPEYANARNWHINWFAVGD